MKKYFWGILAVAVSLQSKADFNGAISSATAGTGRGSIEASDSPFLNPAMISFLRGYYLSSSFSQISEQSSDMTISITDAMKDTILPTSAGYTQGSQRMSDNKKVISKDFRVAFGEKVSDRFGMGLSGHYKNDRTETDSFGQTNLTLGTAMGLTENLSMGLVFDDILIPSSDIPQELRLKPTTSLGLSHNYKRVVRTRLDVISAQNNTFSRPTVAGGIETFMNRWVVLRLGTARDTDQGFSTYSTGLGFRGPRFGLHYAYVTTTEEGNPIRHSIDLNIPVW